MLQWFAMAANIAVLILNRPPVTHTPRVALLPEPTMLVPSPTLALTIVRHREDKWRN